MRVDVNERYNRIGVFALYKADKQRMEKESRKGRSIKWIKSLMTSLTHSIMNKLRRLKKKYDFFDLTRCPVCHGVLKDDAPLACRCGWKGEKKK